MFPDEFHLNTLDQLLSAIARLNPHVNIKAIVIGLMDRLSAYAAREAESEAPEERKQNEEEATTKLLEHLRIAKETEKREQKQDEGDKRTNGEHTNGDQPAETPPQEVDSQPQKDTSADGDAEKTSPKKNRGISEDVKLYEIFYDQVLNLVNAQRLHIQDIVGLLVSLSNLAL